MYMYLIQHIDGLPEEVIGGVNDRENTTYDLFSFILGISHHQEGVLDVHANRENCLGEEKKKKTELMCNKKHAYLC